MITMILNYHFFCCSTACTNTSQQGICSPSHRIEHSQLVRRSIHHNHRQHNHMIYTVYQSGWLRVLVIIFSSVYSTWFCVSLVLWNDDEYSYSLGLLRRRDVSLFLTLSVTLVGCAVWEAATDEHCVSYTALCTTDTWLSPRLCPREKNTKPPSLKAGISILQYMTDMTCFSRPLIRSSAFTSLKFYLYFMWT